MLSESSARRRIWPSRTAVRLRCRHRTVRRMGETIQIETAGRDRGGLSHRRAGDPGVLFYIDAIGLRPRIEEMADRIASWGYVVLAPNVFYRDGTAASWRRRLDLREAGAREAFFASGVMDRVQGLHARPGRPDAEAWVADPARARRGGPIGVTGYCMGARLAVRTAGQFPGRSGRWAASTAAAWSPTADDSPHLAIAESTAEYVFGHADQDHVDAARRWQRSEEALQAGERPHLNEVYEGAAHGYTMADTSVYDEAAAERHFKELEGLLARTLR